MTGKAIKKSTFLVVDDEEFIRSLVKQLLLDLGAHDVLVAEDGVKAMEILQHSSDDVDCVVSDFKMPNMTGIELLQAIRAGSAHVDRNLPFAMLTGYSEKFVIGLAMAMDVDAFIAKPVSKEMLSSRLTPLLTRERQQVLPAKNYARLGLSDTVSNLEDRVSKLEIIIREQLMADPAHRTAADIKAAPVWTPKSSPATASTASPPDQNRGAAPAQPTQSGPSYVNSVAVTLDTVPKDSVLAEDLLSEAGNLVLAAGTGLNERMLDKLEHINDLGEKIDVLHIVEE